MSFINKHYTLTEINSSDMKTIKYFEFVDFDENTKKQNYSYNLTKDKIYKIKTYGGFDENDYIIVDDDNQKQIFSPNSIFASWFKDVTIIIERKLKLEKINEL